MQTGTFDVCQIAAQFGGGGYKQAAGTYLPGLLENAMRLIQIEVEKQLQIR